jgi:hypothetical protein
MPTKTYPQHAICTHDGARAVDTLARSGLYAVHRVGEHVMAYVVTHVPTGLAVGEARGLESARALAAHFDGIAGYTGAAWAFGEQLDMSNPACSRMEEAARTRPVG